MQVAPRARLVRPAEPQAVSAAEFASAMARLGPFGAGRRVALAVSGGADSMAVALLAAEWGDARAFIVDHRLRPDSEAEAALAAERLGARGIPTCILRLHGLAPGPGLPARARAARYAALEAACVADGFVHLLLGHQLGDQAETRLMRAGRGSGPAGLAGMAGIVEHGAIRLLRPLLGIAPARLRATLRQAELGWVEDPTNADRRFLRPRLRAAIAGNAGPLAEAARRDGAARALREAELAGILAEHVAFREEGFAMVSPGPIAADALACVLQAIAGSRYPLPRHAIASLAAAPRAATLGGARLMPAGRLGPGWLVLREQAAIAPPVPAEEGAVWDHRFRLRVTLPLPAGTVIGALGGDAARHRRASGLPAAVLATLPALRRDETVLAVPHIEACEGACFVSAPPRPAACAPFLPTALAPRFAPAHDRSEAGDAKQEEAPYVVE